jgi:hypothetical protein
MKRLMMVALLFALTPLIMGAGGGGNPPIPGLEVIAKKPIYAATFFYDAHAVGASPTAGGGSVTITDHATSTATFPPGTAGFVFQQGFTVYGCTTDPAVTQGRFANQRLVDLIGAYATEQLFGQLGVPVAFDSSVAGRPEFSPIIVAVSNPRCTGSDGSPGPGIQIFDATIKFVVPAQ